MSVTPIREVKPNEEAGEFFGPGTKGTIPKHDGKLAVKTLEELFHSFEADSGVWGRRCLPTPEIPVEVLPAKKTCTVSQALESLGADRERLAFSRSQVASFAEHCDALIPNGGHAGAWMLYWEGTELRWAYVYRATGSDAGLLTVAYDFGEPLVSHKGHVVIVPERR